MPDPIARKRLKKNMLDRWENESGSKTQRAETEARRFRGAPTLRSCDETFRSHARRGVIWQIVNAPLEQTRTFGESPVSVSPAMIIKVAVAYGS